MKDRVRFGAAAMAWATAAVIGAAAHTADASGLGYRSVANGNWKGIAAAGDIRSGGVYAGRTFAGFPSNAKAPIESVGPGVCGAGANVVAAFEARFAGPGPNTGLFLYDAMTDTIIDAVIEGTPTPIGGVWTSFTGVIPKISIDPTTCLVYVGFRGKASGLPANKDSGAFSAVFGPLPGFAPSGYVVIAQEGVTPAPPPFPAGSVFADFPAATSGDAKGSDPATGHAWAAFRGRVTGGGVTGADDTGIFSYSTVPAILNTVVREGDPTCPPPWPGAGPVYDEFPVSVSLGTGDDFGGLAPVVFRAKSRGGSPGTDTAIVSNNSLTCVTLTVYAIEGGGTPVGGTFQDFPSTTPLASAGGVGIVPSPFANVAFRAGIAGVPGTPRALFYNPGGFGNFLLPAVTQGTLVPTALGSGAVTLPNDIAPAVSASSAVPPYPGGAAIFRAIVAGAGDGLFAVEPFTATPFPAEFLGGNLRSPQIDRAGDLTARFP